MPADFSPTLNDYSGIKPFRFWCQKVLPLVYDDSLSYYEMLCKVRDYLNHAIEDVATAEENIDSLLEAYNNLEAFVNTYFDELDVTEEIDAKLDKMALDGSLATIISPIVIRTVNPIVVDSVDDMTNQNRLYVLKSNAHLYQYNGTVFADTGIIYGGALEDVLCYYGVLPSGILLSDVPVQTIYLVTANYRPSDLPVDANGYIETVGTTYSKLQTFTTITGKYQYMRSWNNDAWSGWTEVSNNNSIHYIGAMASPDLLSGLEDQTIAIINSSYTPSDAPISGKGFVLTIGDSTYRKQIYYGRIYYERSWLASNEWGGWFNGYELNGNPSAEALFVINGYIAGDKSVSGVTSRASRDNTPTQIMAKGMNCNGFTVIENGPAGFVYAPTGTRNHATMINLQPIRDYSVIVTNLHFSDMSANIQLGSTSSSPNDGTIAGTVKWLCNRIKTVNPNAQLVILGLLPVTQYHTGDNVYADNTWDNGSTLNALEALMLELASIYHFTYISWKDWWMTYHYPEQCDGSAVLPNNENTIRYLGAYASAHISSSIKF